MNPPTCPFCALIESGNATWVHDGSAAVAFRPLPDSELAPGHTVVAPRRHVDGLLDASLGELESTMALVKKVASAMRSGLGATGTCVFQASGPDSGSSVRHLHFHVVPCWEDDDTTFWPDRKSKHTVKSQPHYRIAAALGS